MSKQLRRAVKGASRDHTPPITPSTTPPPPPPPPTEPPPPPLTEPDNETREEKVRRLLNIVRRPSLSSSLKLSLERGSSAKEVSTTTIVDITTPSDALKRSTSYREQKSPRMTSDQPELAKRTASSGALPSPRRLSVDLTGLLTDRRNSKESPPTSPRSERRKSGSMPPLVLTGTYSRILYYASPMGAFLTPPTVFLVPNDTMSDEIRTALVRAHFAEFGVGDESDEATMKVEAIYLCDNNSTLYKKYNRKKWPAEHFYLRTCIVAAAPDPQLSGDGCKRVVTHEYIFKHPL